MSSFGAELKRERELRQISLREVAEATKISLRHLEALERNDFTELPGGVFNRGFVRAYSQFIGVDPETMVNAYLLEEQAQAGADAGRERVPWRGSRGTGGDHSASGQEERPPRGRRLLRWGLAVLVLVGLIGMVYLVVELVRRDSALTSGTAAPAAVAAAPGGEPEDGPRRDGSVGRGR